MRKVFVLCGALLCLSLTTAAQESNTTSEAGTPAAEPAAPASLTPADREAWQLAFGFQYQHYGVLGQSFHNVGYNVGITRFLNNRFAVEGTAAFGFGSAGSAPSLDAKSMFIGGGPHVVFNNSSRFEPWLHVLAGLQHFRFTQTALVGSNSGVGFMGGGGVDYKFGSRTFWRFQGDFIGTHLGNSIEKNYSFRTGLILNF